MEICKSLCAKEERCDYFSLVEGRRCSRYSGAICNGLGVDPTGLGHTTYAKRVPNAWRGGGGLDEGCIHGGNRVEHIPAGGLPSSDHRYATHLTPVRGLAVGDKIKGLDSGLEPQWCTVAAVEPTGDGELWGNFTDGHFVLRDGQVVTNGRLHGERHTADKWLVMTDCPYGVDESGTVFSALSDFNRHRDPAEPQFVEAGEPATLSLADHLLLHRVYFELVQKTGGFWLNPASFKDMAKVQQESPRGVDLLLSCVNSGDPTSKPCTAWEMLFVEIVDEWLVDPAADTGARLSRSAPAADAAAAEAGLTNVGRVHAAYPGLGHPGAAGSGSVELLHIANRDTQWLPAVVISVAAGVAALVALSVVALVLRCRRAPAQPTLAATEEEQSKVHKSQALAPLSSTCSQV